MGPHRKIVGALHLVFGFGALIPVLILGVVFGGVAGVTALGTHGHPHGAEDTVIVGLTLSAILTIVFFAVGILGLLHIFAGFGIFGRKRWADGLTLLVSALHFFNLPIGTAFTVYTWWTLLKEEPMPDAFAPELKSSWLTA
ncbi:MAG: hypothetical protein QM723_22620 [Myxococcaceae bacterium]